MDAPPPPAPRRAAFLLVGCTASGKTAVAHAIARESGALVLSADSMLVYRGMDVGTAKPTAAERAGVVLRGVDLADPDEPFSAGRWLESAREAAREAAEAGRDLVVAGGTGLYVSALLRGIDTREADPGRRAELEALLAREGTGALVARAESLSPGSTAAIDAKNPRRLVRLVEILESHAESFSHAENAESAEPRSGEAGSPAGGAAERNEAEEVGHAESFSHAENAESAEPRSGEAGSPAGGAAERNEAEGVGHAESFSHAENAESAEPRSGEAGSPAGGAAERSEAEGVGHAPLVGLDFPPDVLNARIERRARAMFEGGLLDEVRALCERFPGFERSTAGAGIGYAEALAALRGEISVDEAVARTAQRTRRLAKKQRTWWRHQARVEWVRGPADEADVARAARDVRNLWSHYGKVPLSL